MSNSKENGKMQSQDMVESSEGNTNVHKEESLETLMGNQSKHEGCPERAKLVKPTSRKQTRTTKHYRNRARRQEIQVEDSNDEDDQHHRDNRPMRQRRPKKPFSTKVRVLYQGPRFDSSVESIQSVVNLMAKLKKKNVPPRIIETERSASDAYWNSSSSSSDYISCQADETQTSKEPSSSQISHTDITIRATAWTENVAPKKAYLINACSVHHVTKRNIPKTAHQCTQMTYTLREFLMKNHSIQTTYGTQDTNAIMEDLDRPRERTDIGSTTTISSFSTLGPSTMNEDDAKKAKRTKPKSSPATQTNSSSRSIQTKPVTEIQEEDGKKRKEVKERISTPIRHTNQKYVEVYEYNGAAQRGSFPSTEYITRSSDVSLTEKRIIAPTSKCSPTWGSKLKSIQSDSILNEIQTKLGRAFPNCNPHNQCNCGGSNNNASIPCGTYQSQLNIYNRYEPSYQGEREYAGQPTQSGQQTPYNQSAYFHGQYQPYQTTPNYYSGTPGMPQPTYTYTPQSPYTEYTRNSDGQSTLDMTWCTSMRTITPFPYTSVDSEMYYPQFNVNTQQYGNPAGQRMPPNIYQYYNYNPQVQRRYF